MKLRKLLALTTALAMLMSMATTAFAVGGSTTGEGEVEFVYNVNVFQVVLPTVSENDTTYDFILDPMGAIAATEGKALDADFTAATMYFANVGENDVVTYSDTSDAKTIINKSSFEVTVTVEATLEAEELGGAVLVDGNDAQFGEAADKAEIALGVVYNVDEDTTKTVYLIEGDATVTMNLAARENAYVVTYDETTGKYSYNLNSSLQDEDFNSMDIQLTGLCNDHDTWSDLGDIAPEVELIWSVEPADEDLTDYDEVNGEGSGSNVTYPRLSNDTTYNSQGQVVPNAQRKVLINLGDSGITSVSKINVVGVKELSTTGCARNVSDGVVTLTFHADVLSTYVGKTIRVTFGNGETLDFVLGAAN